MATCPECDSDIDVDEYEVDKGDLISCPECGSSLEVTNVFDKYYTVNRFDIRSAGVPGVPGQVGRPREWALTVKKDF